MGVVLDGNCSLGIAHWELMGIAHRELCLTGMVHWEFCWESLTGSACRAARRCRFVREKDRACNEYPRLHYPELYVLKGGYREFFPQYRGHCEPQGYRPMHHEDFREDLRRFRLKSRTWAGERGRRELCARVKDR
ncbi:M-phase inducer phosphatase 2-like [Guaruba guarouba]